MWSVSRAVTTTVVVLWVVSRSVAAQPPPDRWPGVAAAYAVELDGALLWGAGIDVPRAPASLAKLLTALVLLDHAWDPEATVTVGPGAASASGSRLGLRSAEKIRAADALTAMLVGSANDACSALVEHAAGSIANFRPRLAQAVQRWGLADSAFVDPCGLDRPGQRTTARDLLRLASVAHAHPEIAWRGRIESASLRTLGGRNLVVRNTNAMIGRMPEAVGLKTGYTGAAGRCLIAMGERGQHRVTLVMLGATPQRWWNASAMMAHALSLAQLPR